jgi:putative transposase
MPWKEIKVMNQRSEFVLRAMQTANFRDLCREYGISTKTGYKWKQGFIEEGLGGMAVQSRRPASTPGGLAETVVCELVQLKQKHSTWGARKIRELYARKHPGQAPSESSVKRVLMRAGLVEKRRVRSRERSGRLHSGRRATTPNEVWTVDFKSWWQGAEGRRCEPLTVRDEFSRYVLELRTLESARYETVRTAFERLFAQHGLPAAIRSDNGSPFACTKAIFGLTRLSAWWLALGIDLERGRPGCPQDNGGHERLHADIAREIEAARLGEQQASLDVWRRTFNHERLHEALAMKCPGEVYTPSPKKYAPLADLTYEKMRRLKVNAIGSIRWKTKLIFLSTALAGWSVGLEPCADGNWAVWFGRLRLGQIDAQTLGFQSAEPVEAPQTTQQNAA